MKNLKKILFPLFALFLTYRSMDLIRYLSSSNPNEYSVNEVLILALLLTLFMTGIFAFPGFAYPTSRILHQHYYKIRNPKNLKLFYKLIGVKYFRVFLLFAFWGQKKNRKKYFDGTRNGFDNFVYQTKQSEFGHLGAFVVIFVSSVYLLIHGYIFLVFAVMALNIFSNLYPIVLQRFHRMRMEKIFKNKLKQY